MDTQANVKSGAAENLKETGHLIVTAIYESGFKSSLARRSAPEGSLTAPLPIQEAISFQITDAFKSRSNMW